MIQKMTIKNRRAKFFHGHALLGKLPVYLFFFLSTRAFERKSEKNKTAWPGDLTTENAIYNENMKIVKEKIEAQLEQNMSKNVIVLDNMQCVFHLSRFRCSPFV